MRVLGEEAPRTVKSDTELLAAFGRFLRNLGPAGHKAVVLQLPVPGLDDVDQVARVIAVAESKWLIEKERFWIVTVWLGTTVAGSPP